MKDEFLADAVARAAHAAERRPRLGAHAARRPLIRRRRGERGIETIERNASVADAARRRPARRVAHRLRQAAPRRAAVRSRRDRRRARSTTVRPAADAKGVELRSQRSIPASARSSGDPDRLQQVVWNLLSNAVKFTPPGGRIGIAIARADSCVRVVVQDSGRGIPRPSCRTSSSAFARLTAHDARYGGLGLGLAMVRHFVEMHGGSVRAESDGIDTGATFTIELPAPGEVPGLPDPAGCASRWSQRARRRARGPPG